MHKIINESMSAEQQKYVNNQILLSEFVGIVIGFLIGFLPIVLIGEDIGSALKEYFADWVILALFVDMIILMIISCCAMSLLLGKVTLEKYKKLFKS